MTCKLLVIEHQNLTNIGIPFASPHSGQIIQFDKGNKEIIPLKNITQRKRLGFYYRRYASSSVALTEIKGTNEKPY